MHVRHWTKTTAECYLRGCICKGCPIYELYFKEKNNCQMKYSVIEAVRKFGVPETLIKSDKENFLK